jgi:polyisoprenoid-binding protein YceI
LHVNTLKKIIKNLIYFLIVIFFCINQSYANERWKIDKEISKISFEVPVLFTTNVKGSFKDIDGFVQLDTKDREKNKAIFSVSINSIEINYQKYKELLLSPIFFNANKYPLGVLDTKNFLYINNKISKLEIELTIKNKTIKIPINLEVNQLTQDLVQIKGKLFFLRSDFNIGTGNWQNTTILKDRVELNYDIFLFRE